VTSTLSEKSESVSSGLSRKQELAIAVNGDRTGSIAAGRFTCPSMGPGNYHSVSGEGLKQEGELSVLDKERSSVRASFCRWATADSRSLSLE